MMFIYWLEHFRFVIGRGVVREYMIREGKFTVRMNELSMVSIMTRRKRRDTPTTASKSIVIRGPKPILFFWSFFSLLRILRQSLSISVENTLF